MVYLLKMGGSFHGYVSHKKMVTSEWGLDHLIWGHLDHCLDEFILVNMANSVVGVVACAEGGLQTLD